MVGLGGVPLSVLGEVGAAEGSKQRGRSSIRHLGEATPGTELGGLTPLGVPESGDARGFVEMADLQGFGVQIGGEAVGPGRLQAGDPQAGGRKNGLNACFSTGAWPLAPPHWMGPKIRISSRLPGGGAAGQRRPSEKRLQVLVGCSGHACLPLAPLASWRPPSVVLSPLVYFPSRWRFPELPGFGDRLHICGQNSRG